MTEIETGRITRFDDADNTCFGCSPHNERGLKLEFVRTGPREVECRYTCAPHFGGMPGVIHGGVQAAILDEVMGVAAHLAFAPEDDVAIATVDFALRYRRPVPTGTEVLIRAELERSEGKDVFVRGEIQDPSGRALTTATARWRQIARRE